MEADAIYHLVGAITMVAGVTLFCFDKREGSNAIKLPGGAGISLSTPSLVILVIGAALFAFPSTSLYRERRSGGQVSSPAPSKNDNLASKDQQVSAEKAKRLETARQATPAPVQGPPAMGDGGWSVYIMHCGVNRDTITRAQKWLERTPTLDVNLMEMGGTWDEPPSNSIVYHPQSERAASAIQAGLESELGITATLDDSQDAHLSRLIQVNLEGADCPILTMESDLNSAIDP